MKRLSLIIALALLVTIGGVFAVWHYDRGAVSLEISRSATMAAIQSDTSKGSITIIEDDQNPNNLKFMVDDIIEGSNAKDYIAELVPTGSITIKFTPAANADQNVKDYGIKMRATVTLQGDQAKYGEGENEKSIFTVKTGANSFDLNDGEATKGNVVINATDIANCLNFVEGVVLDTYEDNVAFENAMKTYTIVVTISEITTPAPQTP